MKQLFKALSFIIVFYCYGMSVQNPSPQQIEELISILHERSNPFPIGSHKKDRIHIIPPATEDDYTRITHFAPRTTQECVDIINRVCSEHERITWYVAHTKEFNLEQRLQKKGLQSFPMGVMMASLSETMPPLLESDYTIQSRSVHQNTARYLLLKNDRPIAQGTLFFFGDLVGIVRIATTAKHSKKGFATTLVKYLMHVAHERNARRALLEAPVIESPLNCVPGSDLYTKLGFKQVMEVNVYNRG